MAKQYLLRFAQKIYIVDQSKKPSNEEKTAGKRPFKNSSHPLRVELHAATRVYLSSSWSRAVGR